MYQSEILERKADALSSYYANLMHWRVEMTVTTFYFMNTMYFQSFVNNDCFIIIVNVECNKLRR